MAAFTKNNRALHDLVSGTRVVALAEVGILRKTAVVCLPFLAALAYTALMVVPSLARLQAGAPGAAGIGGALTAQAQMAKAEGEAFGRGKSEAACVAEAVVRLNSCSDLLCQADAKVFLGSALKSASRGEGSCEDVPQPTSLLQTVKWRISACQSLEATDINACSRIISALQEHCHQPATSSGDAKTAEDFFTQYQTLEKSFDPAIVSLYDDDAVIENNRVYPTGQTRKMTMPAPQYKALMSAALPVAKLRGDLSTYSDVSFTPENGRVRIRAQRFSELKKYTSPISLLVGKNAEGRWVIYQEISESQP